MLQIEKVDDLYQMSLLEARKLADDMYVRRVPGGWLFEAYDIDRGETTGLAFVPLPEGEGRVG